MDSTLGNFGGIGTAPNTEQPLDEAFWCAPAVQMEDTILEWVRAISRYSLQNSPRGYSLINFEMLKW